MKFLDFDMKFLDYVPLNDMDCYKIEKRELKEIKNFLTTVGSLHNKEQRQSIIDVVKDLGCALAQIEVMRQDINQLKDELNTQLNSKKLIEITKELKKSKKDILERFSNLEIK